MVASIGCLNYLIDGLLCNLYVVCGYPDLFVPVSSHQVISLSFNPFGEQCHVSHQN